MRISARTAATIAAISLVTGACAGGNSTGNADGSASAGAINIQGSSTVEPISARIAELFQNEHGGVAIQVGGPGTGTGFKEFFCTGESDISDASRQIKDSERDACAANGIVNILELKIGIDGLTVLTSPANTAVECLGYADLYALLGPESTDLTDWSAANAIRAEVAGADANLSNGEFPAAPLVTAGPGTESGTFDSFLELVMEKTAQERGQEALIRADWSGNANDNVIVQALAGSPSSLGWVGYAFYEHNTATVKALQIKDPERGVCVAPTNETITDGSYPLSRELYIYVNLDKVAANSTLADFVDFYLSDAGLEQVAAAGYVPLDDAAWDATRAAWNDAR